MNANEYQKEAARTLIDGPDFRLRDDQFMLVWCALGLAGESGEVVDHFKKGLMHQHGLNAKKLREELGDVCWYIVSICSICNFNIEDIFQQNIEKLQKRYPNGYNSKDSKKRIDLER